MDGVNGLAMLCILRLLHDTLLLHLLRTSMVLDLSVSELRFWWRMMVLCLSVDGVLASLFSLKSSHRLKCVRGCFCGCRYEYISVGDTILDLICLIVEYCDSMRQERKRVS